MVVALPTTGLPISHYSHDLQQGVVAYRQEQILFNDKVMLASHPLYPNPYRRSSQSRH